MRQQQLFRPTCFARTRKGTLMPGLWQGHDEEGQVIVQPLNSSKRYSFPPECILSVEDAWRQIIRRRIEVVAGSYVFETVMDRPHVIHCYDPRHPRKSNYVLAEGPRGWTCTCPAFLQSRQCKHLVARIELERLFQSTPRAEPLVGEVLQAA